MRCPFFRYKEVVSMPFDNMPGSASVRDLQFVGKGACAAVLERAGMATVADVRAVELDDVSETGPLKRLWRSIKEMKDDDDYKMIADWKRVVRAAYHAILQIQNAEPIASEIPSAFVCPISHKWMTNPVVAVPSGISYEAIHLQRWLAGAPSSDVQDPMARGPITCTVPNVALRRAIQHYRPLEERFLIGPLLEYE